MENPSKLEVIGRCDGMKKPNDHAEPTKSMRTTDMLPYISLTHDTTVHVHI